MSIFRLGEPKLLGAGAVTHQEDIGFPLIVAAKGMLAAAHAVVDEEAHGKDIHALALPLPLSAILMPQLLWGPPAQASACSTTP